MGTVTIEETTRSGSKSQPDCPIKKMDKSILRTQTTTSTSNSTLTLNQNTKILSLYCVEAHRFSVNGDTTTNYFTVNALERLEFGVEGGETLTYRSEA